jgi:hypothetical protein
MPDEVGEPSFKYGPSPHTLSAVITADPLQVVPQIIHEVLAEERKNFFDRLQAQKYSPNRKSGYRRACIIGYFRAAENDTAQ